MPTPPLSAFEIQRRYEAYQQALAEGHVPVGNAVSSGKQGAIKVAAARLGVNPQGVYKAVKAHETAPEKKEPEVSLPVFPDDDIDALSILDHMAKRFKQRKAAADARKWFRVKVSTDEPIGVTWFGDPHIGSNGCNVPLLRRDVDIVSKTPGMFGANIGDTVDGWGGRLIKLYAENDVSKKTERLLARWFLRDSGVKWLLWLHGNHDCHSEDTRLLTKRGWVDHESIEDSDLVLGFNSQSGRSEWQPIKRVARYQHEGEMVHIQTRQLDQLVTANHRVFARRYLGKKKYGPWEFFDAAALPNNFCVQTNATVQTAGVALTDDQIRFAAWILTDGHINARGDFTIFQSKDGGKIEAVLAGCGFKYSVTTRVRSATHICGKALKKPPLPTRTYYILAASKPAAQEIIKTKDNLPPWVDDLDERQFDVFMGALLDGDGARATNRGVHSSAVLHGRREFLEQVQAAAVAKGWRAHLSVAREKDYRLNVCKRSTAHAITSKNVSVVPYSGTVWCLEVPLGNFMVSRNGKPCFSGNSMSGDFTHYMEACNVAMVPMIDWRAQFIVAFPNGCEVKVDASHNHKGHSMWNELHGQERAAYMEEATDLIIAGHHHTWAHKAKEMPDGRVVQLVRARGYKFLDTHAARWQFAEQQNGASIVTILNPLSDSPTERVKVFADVEAGADYLGYLRNRAKGGGNGKPAKRGKT